MNIKKSFIIAGVLAIGYLGMSYAADDITFNEGICQNLKDVLNQKFADNWRDPDSDGFNSSSVIKYCYNGKILFGKITGKGYAKPSPSASSPALQYSSFSNNPGDRGCFYEIGTPNMTTDKQVYVSQLDTNCSE